MVVLRATRKVLRSLRESAQDGNLSDTALGDWYVNRIVIDRQPLLLFVSSASLLAALAPARAVKSLAEWFPEIVFDRLKRLDVDLSLIGSEMEAMKSVHVGRTKDRSVTGQMVDFAKALPYYLPVDGWNATEVQLAEERLAETPCRGSRGFDEMIFPRKEAVRLLQIHSQPRKAAYN